MGGLEKTLPSIDRSFKDTLTFKTATPTTKSYRYARDVEHIFCYLLGGVTTYAAQGEFMFIPKDDPTQKSATISLIFASNGAWVRLSEFIYVERFNQDHEGRPPKECIEKSIKRCNFAQWLDAEAVRFQYFDADGSLAKFSISREDLIRRVANAYDGSHPSAAQDPNEKHKLDDPIKHLMSHRLANLNLPYFILLKIAKDIIEYATKVLKAD